MEQCHEVIHGELRVLDLITTEGGGGKLAFLLLKGKDSLLDGAFHRQLVNVDVPCLA